ncbi:PilZ domain-containing protein [Vibrio sp. TRT 21S02]|uniref:PilZ domain-containing protein n=1 Tax=Vibrio sp. TRT 21S02 TaxID=3418507 RepID=UPI003CE900A0
MTEQEFFTVHHQMTVNVEPLSADFVLPSNEVFVSEIPAPFLVASEFSQLDQLSDNARSELKTHELKHVIALLDNQNEKLNLLLTFMLSQQDDATHRSTTTRFGASLFTYRARTPLQTGQKARVKLFLEHPAAAIYCYAHCVSVEQEANDTLITMKYDLLRDIDEDLLIKAALYQQQKLLRQRSLNRDKK